MQGNFIMLQKEDLKEAIAEVLETMVGKNLLKEPTRTASTEYYTRDELCARLHITFIPPCGVWKSVATSRRTR